MAPDEFLPSATWSTHSRLLRSTPKKLVRASSDSEKTLTVQTVIKSQSPASVKKLNHIGTRQKSAMPQPEASSLGCPGGNFPIESKIRKVGSARTSLGSGENAIAKTLMTSLKQKERADKKEAAQEKKVRRANPGVRVVGGKVYDSENGVTCHQCRQKTMESTALCKEGSAKCKRGFCSKCLFNRYGEQVDEVSQLPAWPCPFCRGVCNCSNCRKKNGLQATGILTHMAKAQGFGCVAALLKTTPKATQPPSSERILKQASPNSAEVPHANALDGSSPARKGSNKRFPAFGKRKRPSLASPQTDGSHRPPLTSSNAACLSEQAILALPSLVSERTPETPEPMTPPTKRLKAPGLDMLPMRKQESTKRPPQQQSSRREKGAEGPTIAGGIVNGGEKKRRKKTGVERAEAVTELPKPNANSVTKVLGVAVSPVLAGDVLQILEFLATFTAVVDLPCVSETRLLQELLEAGRLPRGDRSMLGQVQSRLLSILRQDQGQSSVSSSQWLPSLHDHLNAHPTMHHLLQQTLDMRLASETQTPSAAIADTVPETPGAACPSGGNGQAGRSGVGTAEGENEGSRAPVQNGLSEGVRILDALVSGGYTLLSPTDRVFLLKLLCDDALETPVVRSHMEGALATAEESARQQRKELAVAREEVKDARAALREVELTQLLGLKGERTPEAEQVLVASIQEKAARVSASLAAAKRIADSCQEGVECRPIRLVAVGAHSRGIQYWNLVAANAHLMSQVLSPGQMGCDSWLQTSPSELVTFKAKVASQGVPGKRLEGRLRAAFPEP